MNASNSLIRIYFVIKLALVLVVLVCLITNGVTGKIAQMYTHSSEKKIMFRGCMWDKMDRIEI